MGEITKEQALAALENLDNYTLTYRAGDIETLSQYIEQQPDSAPTVEREAWLCEQATTVTRDDDDQPVFGGWRETIRLGKPHQWDGAPVRNIRRVMVTEIDQ